ncbi:MAG: hypothetical protein J6T91_01590 [Alphaproteobacteria bacterium]|nr:hypothetical protein [Alphaproteobacteria bacterium]
MKKILFVLMISVPSLAMDTTSYETRLENVETAVVEIKDVLDDKTDSSTGEITPGLKSKVEDIEGVLNDKEDPGAGPPILGLISKIDGSKTNPNLGLMNQMQQVKSLLNYRNNTFTRVDDIEIDIECVKKLLDYKTDAEGSAISGLKSRVDDIDTTLTNEGIPGLKSKVEGIEGVLNDKEDPDAGPQILGLKSKIDGTETNPTLGLIFQVRQIQDILEYIPNDPNTHAPTFRIILRVDNLETDMDHIKDLLDYRTDLDGRNPTSGLKSQVESNKTKVSTLEGDITEIKDVLNDKEDPGAGPLILGLKSKIDGTSDNPNLGLMNQMQQVKSLLNYRNNTFKRIDDIETEIEALNKSFNDMKEKIDNYNLSMDEKFQKYIQEYMDVKKQVHDVIANCKANGQDSPAYIMETADQLQSMDLETRRKVLSEILDKLKVFESLLDSQNNPLLDSNKMKSIQTYLNNTNVPKPEMKEIQPILNYIIEGEYIKVTGATREFTRSVGFKTGLPTEDWMDQSYDYFAYGFLPIMKNAIFSENSKRGDSNEAIKEENAKAQAKYDAAISAAERATFPADNLTTLINDYNRILLRHEI